jgi:hypothetical protein
MEVWVMDGRSEADRALARSVLARWLAAVGRGELDASPESVAYVTGVVHGLAWSLGDKPPEPEPAPYP